MKNVKISYTCRLDQRASDLGGSLEIKGDAQWKYGRAYSMNVWLNFLDSERKYWKEKALCEASLVITGDLLKTGSSGRNNKFFIWD